MTFIASLRLLTKSGPSDKSPNSIDPLKPFTLLFLCFLLIPIAEIYLLIQIGEVIGAGWTVLGVVSTALIGAWLVRIQGILTLHRAIQNLRKGEAPAMELIEGLFLLVAGALLITPGFVTDTIGFLCLTPRFRRALAAICLSHFAERLARKDSSTTSETFEVKYREIKNK